MKVAVINHIRHIDGITNVTPIGVISGSLELAANSAIDYWFHHVVKMIEEDHEGDENPKVNTEFRVVTPYREETMRLSDGQFVIASKYQHFNDYDEVNVTFVEFHQI